MSMTWDSLSHKDAQAATGSEKARTKGTAFQAAEQVGFVSGHDFSRAVKSLNEEGF
jgi:hypothetical protein